MPLFQHPMLWPFRSDGKPVQLAREAHRKIANIDHLLHLAFAFGNDFASFKSHEPAEVWLGLTQSVADLAHQLAAPGRGDLLPFLECGLRLLNRAFVLLGRRSANSRENSAVNGR